MATTITAPSGNFPYREIQPSCDEAASCHWFETPDAYSPCCANRDNLVCPKKRRDVFAPTDDRRPPRRG